MIIFNADLDNTLIYSYRHDIGERKICVEMYEGREFSFMTEKSHQMLKEITKKVVFVPTTTRSIEQYQRINLGVGMPKYALVCNGGVLLVDGKEDEAWFRTSQKLAEDSRESLKKAEKYLETDESIDFEIRKIKGLFLFTKSRNSQKTVMELKKILDLSLVDVFHNGAKVYVVPKKLSKGMAVKRLREKLKADKVIAAGDSTFDITMLEEADYAIMPRCLEGKCKTKGETAILDRTDVFSDDVLVLVKSFSFVL